MILACEGTYLPWLWSLETKSSGGVSKSPHSRNSEGFVQEGDIAAPVQACSLSVVPHLRMSNPHLSRRSLHSPCLMQYRSSVTTQSATYLRALSGPFVRI